MSLGGGDSEWSEHANLRPFHDEGIVDCEQRTIRVSGRGSAFTTKFGRATSKAMLIAQSIVPTWQQMVHTMNFGNQCPYDPARIKEPVIGEVFEIEVERRIGY